MLEMLKCVASIKITISKENETKLFKMENLQIKDVNKLMDGGVYLFTINEIPLYVGETYNFFIRFSKHLVELDNNTNYFGLSQLEKGKYDLGFYIIKDKLPYDGIRLPINMRATDKNKKDRTDGEKQSINDYRPMTQLPPQECNIQYTSNKKYDGMIKDGNVKDEIVKTIIKAPAENGYCYDMKRKIYAPNNFNDIK